MARTEKVVDGRLRTAGDAAVDGLLAGAAAGIAMAAYLVVIGLVAGEGPAVVLARFDPSGAGAASPLIGALMHLAVSAVYGLLFGLIYRLIGRGRLAGRAAGALMGLVYGLALLLVAQGLALTERGRLAAGDFGRAFRARPSYLRPGVGLAGRTALTTIYSGRFTMIVNIVSLLVLVLLVVLFAWLATRAWRAKRAFVKWPGVILTGLLTLVFAAVTVVAVLGFVKLEARHANPVADLKVAGTAEQIARGGATGLGLRRLPLADARSAVGRQHREFIAGGPPLGVIYATNLTPGGPLQGWTDGEIVRAIREGIANDGRALIVMPSQAYRHLSDADVQALVAYLRSQPAVNNPQPARNMNILAALFVGAGLFPTSAQAPVGVVSAPPPVPPPSTASTWCSAGGCADCHGAKLDGVPQQFIRAAGAVVEAVRCRYERGPVHGRVSRGTPDRRRPGGGRDAVEEHRQDHERR